MSNPIINLYYAYPISDIMQSIFIGISTLVVIFAVVGGIISAIYNFFKSTFIRLTNK